MVTDGFYLFAEQLYTSYAMPLLNTAMSFQFWCGKTNRKDSAAGLSFYSGGSRSRSTSQQGRPPLPLSNFNWICVFYQRVDPARFDKCNLIWNTTKLAWPPRTISRPLEHHQRITQQQNNLKYQMILVFLNTWFLYRLSPNACGLHLYQALTKLQRNQC